MKLTKYMGFAEIDSEWGGYGGVKGKFTFVLEIQVLSVVPQYCELLSKADWYSDRGSLLAKVMDSWLSSHVFEPKAAEDHPCKRGLFQHFLLEKIVEAQMPSRSRMENTTFAMPSIIDSYDMGLRTVYSPDAQKKTPIQRLFMIALFVFVFVM
ncbi:hypothetical protein TNCV_1245641 [Trichonephila clavipes]|uniref:Uncharacterized protein n=1 Tax=Trichonephila clavipes TaxID=2585209 RepID=A0A8X6RF97_TRICX|nr:hypothetical protein TNCV_1245641 [Trichonephila clavipes]